MGTSNVKMYVQMSYVKGTYLHIFRVEIIFYSLFYSPIQDRTLIFYTGLPNFFHNLCQLSNGTSVLSVSAGVM